jgi:hypothetical protein
VKKLILILTFTASSAFAGWHTDTVNGQTYNVYHSDGSSWTSVDGPDGYHADGYTFPGGDTDWTVNPGYHRAAIDGQPDGE